MVELQLGRHFLKLHLISFYIVLGCTLNICQNGGLCQAITNGYVCICPAGYTGTNCQSGNFSFFIVVFN